jgi:hypothetical protein
MYFLFNFDLFIFIAQLWNNKQSVDAFVGDYWNFSQVASCGCNTVKSVARWMCVAQGGIHLLALMVQYLTWTRRHERQQPYPVVIGKLSFSFTISSVPLSQTFSFVSIFAQLKTQVGERLSSHNFCKFFQSTAFSKSAN